MRFLCLIVLLCSSCGTFQSTEHTQENVATVLSLRAGFGFWAAIPLANLHGETVYHARRVSWFTRLFDNVRETDQQWLEQKLAAHVSQLHYLLQKYRTDLEVAMQNKDTAGKLRAHDEVEKSFNAINRHLNRHMPDNKLLANTDFSNAQNPTLAEDWSEKLQEVNTMLSTPLEGMEQALQDELNKYSGKAQ